MKKYQFAAPMGVVLILASAICPHRKVLADNRIAACYSKPHGLTTIISNGLAPTQNENSPDLINRCNAINGKLVIWSQDHSSTCFQPNAGDSLVGCNFTLPGVNFPQSLDLRGIKATDAILNNLTLSGFNFTGADFSNASLVGTVFSSNTPTNLNYVNFTHASLTDTNFQGSDLKVANFSLAPLSNVNLTDSNLTETSFINAIVNSTTLINSNLKFADFTGSTLNNVNFSNSNLCGAQLPQDCSDGCIIDGTGIVMTPSTVCPDGFPLGGTGGICQDDSLIPASVCP